MHVATDAPYFVSVHTFITVQLSKLEYLRPVLAAYAYPREGCLEGTRVELLFNLMQWIMGINITDIRDNPIYAGMYLKNVVWLYDMAGSGKTVVANTITTILTQQEFYLACFFCKRDEAELSTAANIFLTLSYQLNIRCPTYRDAILRLMDSPDANNVLTADLNTQVERLFITPLLNKVEEPLPLVLLVDALDECSD